MISGSTRYARHLGFFGGLGAKVEENVFEKATGLNFIPEDGGIGKGLRISAKPSAIFGAILGASLGVMGSRPQSKLQSAMIGSIVGGVLVSAIGWAKTEGF